MGQPKLYHERPTCPRILEERNEGLLYCTQLSKTSLFNEIHIEHK